MKELRVFYLAPRARIVATLIVGTIVALYSLLSPAMSMADAATFVAGVSACTFLIMRGKLVVRTSSIQIGRRKMPFEEGKFELEAISGAPAWLLYGKESGYALSYTPINGKKRRLYFAFEDADAIELEELLLKLSEKLEEDSHQHDEQA